MASKKSLREIIQGGEPHWVGDGFPVRTLFSMYDVGQRISPFLLLDYAAPTIFEATGAARGVDSHPHRGFETVTIVYQGGLEHRDSAGNHGTIGPGDVQWMTAASGVLHEEKHERQWAAKGGAFQVAQLWVNLPAAKKMSAPGYQTLTREVIPVVKLPEDAGTARVIAGEFSGVKGAAKTASPVNVFDVRLTTGKHAAITVPSGQNTAVVVFEGSITVEGKEVASAGEIALFDPAGEQIDLVAREDSLLLVLSGEPLNEPVVAYGPFVMNTKEQIVQAANDFRAGKMGRLD